MTTTSNPAAGGAVWAFTAFRDSLAGTLILLPDSTLARRVAARRVPDSAVPAAPARVEYGLE